MFGFVYVQMKCITLDNFHARLSVKTTHGNFATHCNDKCQGNKYYTDQTCFRRERSAAAWSRWNHDTELTLSFFHLRYPPTPASDEPQHCNVIWCSRMHIGIVADCVSRERNAIGSVRPSVCLQSIFWTEWLEILCVGGHDHSSPGNESQGHGSRSKVKVKCQSYFFEFSLRDLLKVNQGQHQGKGQR